VELILKKGQILGKCWKYWANRQGQSRFSHHALYDTKMDGLVDTGQNFSQLDIQGM